MTWVPWLHPEAQVWSQPHHTSGRPQSSSSSSASGARGVRVPSTATHTSPGSLPCRLSLSSTLDCSPRWWLLLWPCPATCLRGPPFRLPPASGHQLSSLPYVPKDFSVLGSFDPVNLRQGFCLRKLFQLLIKIYIKMFTMAWFKVVKGYQQSKG